MSIHIRIADQPWTRGIGVYVFRGAEQVGWELRLPDGDWTRPSEGADLGADPGPTFHLRDEEARALLEALIRHYQGAEDTRSLRKDYDAERARVDKFIDVFTTRMVSEE